MNNSLFGHHFGHCLLSEVVCVTHDVLVVGSTSVFRSLLVIILFIEMVEEVTFTDILKQQIDAGQNDYCLIKRHIMRVTCKGIKTL
jgi:hypothetical protein